MTAAAARAAAGGDARNARRVQLHHTLVRRPRWSAELDRLAGKPAATDDPWHCECPDCIEFREWHSWLAREVA